jgi:ABC-2 type transport system ATP-binding protein
MLRAEEVRKKYPGAREPALKGLSLTIERGEIFGFDGQPASRVARKRFGLVPQDLALYPRLTAEENLEFFGSLFGLERQVVRARAKKLLDAVGLTDRAIDRVDTYSGGMKRRLNLVAGLIHEPDVLFLDEPTVGVDPQSRNRIFDLVRDLKRGGLTILYTTHYMEEAMRLCDRIAIMDHGKLLLEGKPETLVREHGRAHLELELDSPVPEGAGETFRNLEGVVGVSVEGNRVQLLLAELGGAPAVIERVLGAATRRGLSATVRGLTPPSLEAVFLDLTGRSLRDESEGPR